jgi:hypothetical protein
VCLAISCSKPVSKVILVQWSEPELFVTKSNCELGLCDELCGIDMRYPAISAASCCALREHEHLLLAAVLMCYVLLSAVLALCWLGGWRLGVGLIAERLLADAAGCLALGLLPSVETGRQKYP